MCWHITAILPHTVDLKAAASVFESHKLGFELISNPHVAAQIDPQAWHVLTTRKHCDCGTALGSLARRATDTDSNHDRMLKKFRKQGWSEAKIKRWLEQKEQTRERHQREDEALEQGSSYEVDRWIKFLNDLVGGKVAQKCGLLLHAYHPRIEGERIKIQRKESMKLSDVKAERLMRIEDDVLYEFVL